MTDSSCIYVSLHRCLSYHLVGFVSFIITSHDVLRRTNYLCTDTTCRTYYSAPNSRAGLAIYLYINRQCVFFWSSVRSLHESHFGPVYHTRELSRPKMRMSSAPTLTSSSITFAIFDLSTIALTATHSVSSNGDIVGARRPGVTAVAAERTARRTLY